MEMETGNAGAAAPVVGEEDVDGRGTAKWIIVDDESTAELSKVLDLFDTTPPPIKVRFLDDPYSSLALFRSFSYVTINGNEESCGSSFSVSDSSVMAGLDVGCSWGERFDCAKWWAERSVVGAVEKVWGNYVEDNCT